VIRVNLGPCYLCNAETTSALPSGVRVCGDCRRKQELPQIVRGRALDEMTYSNAGVAPVVPSDVTLDDVKRAVHEFEIKLPNRGHVRDAYRRAWAVVEGSAWEAELARNGFRWVAGVDFQTDPRVAQYAWMPGCGPEHVHKFDSLEHRCECGTYYADFIAGNTHSHACERCGAGFTLTKTTEIHRRCPRCGSSDVARMDAKKEP
jgi:hypothetical protein